MAILFKHVATSTATQLFIGHNTFFYLLPLAGAVMVGVILRLMPGAGGEGVRLYVDAVERDPGKLSLRGTIGHFGISAMVLASGGSGGMAGPMLRGGAGIGQRLGLLLPRWLTADGGARRLAICGAASAASAVLFAPLTGTILAVEVLYAENLSYIDLMAALLSGVGGFVVVSAWGSGAPFVGMVTHSGAANYWYLPAIFLTAIVSTAFGALFVRFFRWFQKSLGALIAAEHYRVLAGAALVAATASVFGPVGRAAMGVGEGFVRDITSGRLPEVSGLPREDGMFGALALYLILLVAAKTLTTSFTVGSGMAAGLVHPSILMGAAVGAAVSALFHLNTPATMETHWAFVACGMSAFLATVMNVPLAAAAFVVEMFGFEQSFAGIIGAVTAFALARHLVTFSYVDKRGGAHL